MLIFIYNGKMTGPFLFSPFIENIGNHLVPAVHTVIFLRMFSIDPDFLCLYRLKKEHFECSGTLFIRNRSTRRPSSFFPTVNSFNFSSCKGHSDSKSSSAVEMSFSDYCFLSFPSLSRIISRVCQASTAHFTRTGILEISLSVHAASSSSS